MQSRSFVGIRALVFPAALVVAFFGCPIDRIAADPPTRPNIVIIVCDDMGFSDLGCYGGEIDTPHLDALAAGGVRMVDFHNNAKCSETRASLLTGLWHQQTKNLKNPNHVTLAEVLGSAGYRSLMVGKWHVAGEPVARGFDRYFGFLGGCINFFNGLDWGSGENLMRLDTDPYEAPEGFYSTDAFTDYAIDFLSESADPEEPFFLYLAHNAPHFPLQAPEETIAKYRGRYQNGWDELRKQRYERLRALGLIDQTWRLSGRDAKVEAWQELSEAEKSFMEPMMAVYAAMVDRLDQNIGRLVKHLRETNRLDNTLLCFFSDNGACPYERLIGDVMEPGPEKSNIAYDARWANACNTPLRNYKQYAHHGGTLTPMIVHWPDGIQARGEINHATGHLVDLMPTCVELAGATYPTEFDGHEVLPMEGVSLVNAWTATSQDPRQEPIFWEFSGNHAVRDGKWKLVAERSKDWELYNVAADRCETDDVSDEYPEVVRRLAKQYDLWAKRCGSKTHAKSMKTKPSSQSQLFDFGELLSVQAE